MVYIEKSGLSSLANLINHGIEEIDTTGTILYWNEALCKLHGYKNNEYRGKKIWDLSGFLSHENQKNDLKTYFEYLLLEQPEPKPYFQKIRNKNGKIIDNRIDWNYHRDESGKIIGFISIITDVTAQTKTEETLKRKSLALEALTECRKAVMTAVSEAMLLQSICDIITRIIGFRMVWIGFAENDEMQSIKPVAESGFDEGYLEKINISWGNNKYGKGPAGRAIQTKKPAFVLDILNDPYFAPWRNQAIKRGYASTLSIPLMNGEHAFGSINIFSEKLEEYDDELIQIFLKLADDLSYGLNVLRSQEDKLRTEKFFDNLFENGPNPTWISDDHGTMIRQNQACRDVLFVTDEDVIGKYNIFKDEVVKEQGVLPEVRRVYERGETVQFHIEYDRLYMKNLKSPDSFIILDAIMYPIKNKAGTITNAVVQIVDVTKRIVAERERDKMRQQVFQTSKLASIGILAQGVAHEINNPLSIIQGNVEFLNLDWKEKKEDQHESFDRIDQSIERIKKIVNGLSIYGRTKEDDIENLNIHRIIDNSIALISSIYDKENIYFDRSYKCENPIILGNKGKLQQVIMNLFSNARDAMKENGGNIKIHSIQVEDSIQIDFIDQGCGISNKIMDKIFDPFFTTKEPGKGTGLGLGITSSLVEEMEGKIFVKSELGEGTKFTITLPLSDLHEDYLDQSKTFNKYDPIKGNALIVDDETEIRLILRSHLESFGLSVDDADDGDIALEKLKKRHYKYLVTDLKMPRKSGESLVMEAKNLKKTPDKVIVITGGVTVDRDEYNPALPIEKSVKMLKKPFSKTDLYQIIKDA